jgi:co-chaperonin GroES (HSP10)
MKLTPLRDKIIVKPEKRIQSTLYIQSAEADSVGHVVAAGPDALAEGLNVGDKVYFGTLAKDYKDEYLKFEEIQINNERHLKMSWMDICFVEES